MGRPLDFPEANVVYWPPAGLEDDVVPLQVRRDDHCLVSCWKMSADELAEIARTGVVWLSVMGTALPPVMVSGRRAEVMPMLDSGAHRT